MVDRHFAELHLAALYDLYESWEWRPELGFYLPLVMSAGSVLDVGCGTGELLRLARGAGHRGRLCGLDPAEAMLAQARQEPNVEWVLGDAASARWEHEFELVVMTGHAFQVLVEDVELNASLAAIRSALTADGRFAFETRNPLVRAWEQWTPDGTVEVVSAAGAEVRRTCEADPGVAGELVSFTTTFTCPRWDGPETSRSRLRFLDAASLSRFLSGASLVIEEQFGHWDRRPLTESSAEIITIARRAASTHGAP